ncbi:MerR family transcriptional regulator [Streptomyces sp. NP160]|uniref:MerR family transcriptional regulator n=1 Tax=Streptomyces sp. NP160 TaxID=2586637 RepID=UPI00111A8948|nr:MerR family transcriptional regulator [Streptomyces sp. NP160]TNM59815.1 MerR family transcriptional regulator [Streptomyces sp. NP160]
MKIGELAARTGVSVRSLRYYEQQQMLLPTRTSGGQRLFDEDAVERVGLIQLLFAAGISSPTVVTLLPCIYSGTTTPEMVARLDRERSRLAERARSLAATVEALDDVIAEARTRVTATTSQPA